VSSYFSAYGVDGILPPVSSADANDNCAHPANTNNQAAWFVVNLGSVHLIYNVTIYNTRAGGGIGNRNA
jgi:hypothetical protein